jgi:hypothetical protein
VLIALHFGCTSTSTVAPIVTISQTSNITAIRAASETAIPVTYRLDVTNPLDDPVTLLSVEIETVGESGAYAMRRVRHSFNQKIAAHTSSAIDLRAWVRPLLITESGRVVTPVMLRGTARFESMGSTIQSAFTGRLAQ